jgi:hypothetical protein
MRELAGRLMSVVHSFRVGAEQHATIKPSGSLPQLMP